MMQKNILFNNFNGYSNNHIVCFDKSASNYIIRV